MQHQRIQTGYRSAETPALRNKSRLKRPWPRPLVFFGKAIVLLLSCAVLWVVFLQACMALLPDKALAPHDTGIVLGAALWQNQPSPALKERLDRAVSLYRKGTIRSVIVTGGYDTADAKMTEAEGMRDYLARNGIPAKSIYLENEARSTYENLKFSKRIMEAQGLHSAIIVTHRYHAVRALDMASFLGYDSPKASPMDTTVLMMSWHKTRETLAMTKWQWDKVMLLFGQEPINS